MPSETPRYARQTALPEIGEAGQIRLLGAHVMVVGAGGLGSPAAFYLAAAGVGHLGLMDADAVELSNLQRQILHPTAALGDPKAVSGCRTLAALNPEVTATPIQARLTPDNAVEMLDGYDFVIDATDNFDSKFLIADSCHQLGIPYSHAGIDRFLGQVMTVIPGQTTCYRCLFREAPPPVPGPTRGPLGAVPGVVGTIQAAEAIKCLLGIGDLLTDRILICDLLAATFRTVPVKRMPDCPLCGAGEAE